MTRPLAERWNGRFPAQNFPLEEVRCDAVTAAGCRCMCRAKVVHHVLKSKFCDKVSLKLCMNHNNLFIEMDSSVGIRHAVERILGGRQEQKTNGG